MGLSFQIFGTGGLAMKMCLAILCKHQNYDELNGCKGGKKRKKSVRIHGAPTPTISTGNNWYVHQENYVFTCHSLRYNMIYN